MSFVAKKRRTPENGAPPPEKRNAINARLPDKLAAALKAYLESRRPAPTSTAVVLVALEEFLSRQGFWPG